IRRQPETAKPFIKASQPAWAAPIIQPAKLWMHWPAHGELPTEEVAPIWAPPQPHAARRQDRVRERSVVHFDQIDPLAQPAAQGPFADRPIMRRRQAEIVIADSEAGESAV